MNEYRKQYKVAVDWRYTRAKTKRHQDFGALEGPLPANHGRAYAKALPVDPRIRGQATHLAAISSRIKPPGEQVCYIMDGIQTGQI